MKKIGDIAYAFCSSVQEEVKGHSALFLDWDKIVGDYFADMCSPFKIYNENGIFVLFVKISDPRVFLDFQYKENVLLARINNFLIDKKISKIKASL